jgi:hypothetical protein
MLLLEAFVNESFWVKDSLNSFYKKEGLAQPFEKRLAKKGRL